MTVVKTACQVWLASILLNPSIAAVANETAPGLRIDSVVAIPDQPASKDPAVIWFDDFESDEQWNRYAEKSGTRDQRVGCGDSLSSLRMDYAAGSRGVGGVKVFFGDSPAARGKRIRPNERFDDVYWRVYVKHQSGWVGGGPDKLSRATSMTSPQWAQAMIAHVWSSGESLTLDPATGIKDGRVMTRRYNDFEKLRWLGNRPVSPMKIHSSEESGWWICVEARAKLNTPGRSDGLQQLWIDSRLQCERLNLDWRGSYDQHGINAVFLEAYWDEGSPVDQSRWIDDFVISTRPIGARVVSRAPILIRSDMPDTDDWEVEIAAMDRPDEVVWRSKLLRHVDRVTINANAGTFFGELAGTSMLSADSLYVARIRSSAREWSPWHQTFRTDSAG